MNTVQFWVYVHTSIVPDSLNFITYHLSISARGEGFKGRGGATDPPNFSVSSVIYMYVSYRIL
ncbi:hypothetical protein HanXRQr2_Chr13g0568361 [Helianthus annuus]|uniref:Uncharacterized protein n=1 Tax=Helianthus annuus TaxID=4232 RepID=A0A9K3HAB3_HELAN|nr:hypothetical protein HanXRQr2_Chr13g0568361 [Helianthus annuus]